MEIDLKEIKLFKADKAFEKWLERNAEVVSGIWLKIYKKASGKSSVSYAEALDVALCHGWIDGQKRSFDEEAFLQRFTPRRPKSTWSKINTAHAERLIEQGRMRPAGQRQIDAAKTDGRWGEAYGSPKEARLPEDFLARVKKNRKAWEFLATLNKANTYVIVHRLQTARTPATRARRIEAIVEKLEQGKKFH